MNKVNRIEILTPGGTTIIEDHDLIKEVVDTTMVAKMAGVSYAYWEGVYFRLYNDDVLVREMEYDAKHNCIVVYRPSIKHWFFLTGGARADIHRSHEHVERYGGGGGWVQLSDELVYKINEFLLEHGDSLWGWGHDGEDLWGRETYDEHLWTPVS